MKKIILTLVGVGDDFITNDKGENQSPAEQQQNNPPVEKVEEKKPPVEQPKAELTSELPNHKDVVTIDREVLQALLDRVKDKTKAQDEVSAGGEKLSDLISELIDSNRMGTRNYLGGRPVDMVNVDPSDVLEVPVMFFAHSIGYAIWDDKRMGRTIKPPYGRSFKFKKVFRDVQQMPGSRNPIYTSISALIVHSKKEADWLRGHTLFGFKFFEKLGEARDTNAEMAEALVMAWNIVASFDESQVVTRCTNSNIPIDTMDFVVLRRKLARKMAEANIRTKNSQKGKALEDFEKFLVGDIPVQTDGQTHKEVTKSSIKVDSPF